MKILGLIPARGGSKGVVRKNAKKILGKELVRYSIETALACPFLDKVIVSTDDEEIASVSRKAGAEVPFMRPAALAADDSPTIDTIRHALNYFAEQGAAFDAVCLLQPTVPFRNINDLNAALRKFREKEMDSLISVRPVPHVYNPHWVYQLDEETGFLKLSGGDEPIPRRQDLPAAYHRDGSVYLCKQEVVLTKNSLYGEKIFYHVMVASPNINIDTGEDWAAAEAYANTQINTSDV